MIDMSGWASVGELFDGSTRALTREEVRALLDEGREVGREIRRRMRTPPPCGVCGEPFERCPRCDR